MKQLGRMHRIFESCGRLRATRASSSAVMFLLVAGVSLFASRPVLASVIDTVSITASFENSTGTFTGFGDVKIGATKVLTLAHGGSSVALSFSTEFIRTDDEGGGNFSDVVKITYNANRLLGPATLIFDGHDAKNALKIDSVLKVDPFWKLQNAVPSFFPRFTADAAPVSASFTVDYSYRVPEPRSFAMLLAGIGLLAWLIHRREHLS